MINRTISPFNGFFKFYYSAGKLCHGVWNLLCAWSVVHCVPAAVWLLLLLLSLLWQLWRKRQTSKIY